MTPARLKRINAMNNLTLSHVFKITWRGLYRGNIVDTAYDFTTRSYRKFNRGDVNSLEPSLLTTEFNVAQSVLNDGFNFGCSSFDPDEFEGQMSVIQITIVNGVKLDFSAVEIVRLEKEKSPIEKSPLEKFKHRMRHATEEALAEIEGEIRKNAISWN
jgi:hypothetical protein